ncbi:MAG: NADH-quinone oxidoreductase subunit J [Rhodocyclaceae bacterium]|nr:NADH-quinone oxidoreductase subunit J [Rhodocyclaceae bacterium]
MDLKTTLFYIFSAITVYAALRVITARNPVHAVLHLVLAFFTTGALWILLQAEFLAIAIIMVYVGAVMVLFLFVVMMLDINIERLRKGFWNNLIPGAIVGLFMVGEMIAVLSTKYFGIDSMPAQAKAADYSNTKELGRLLFTDYVYPFELASVILLVAIIAAVVLTMRRRQGVRYLDPAKQIAVHHRDRIRVVAMKTERESTAAGEGQ